MKTNTVLMGIFLAGAVLLQGCVIGFPPLVNVESKEAKNENKKLMKRLDAIDKRLAELEKQRVASAIVCDGVSAAAVVFAPEYGNEDDHQI